LKLRPFAKGQKRARNVIRKKLLLFFFITFFIVNTISLFTYYTTRVLTEEMNDIFSNDSLLTNLSNTLNSVESHAKEAIQLGVIEYLNKPLTRKSLIDALENAVNRKEQEQIKLKTELDYREKIAYARPALENSLIHCITFPGNHDAEIASLEKILDISGGGYIMTIEIRPGEGKERGAGLPRENRMRRDFTRPRRKKSLSASSRNTEGSQCGMCGRPAAGE
jgi:hypothetical protein